MSRPFYDVNPFERNNYWLIDDISITKCIDGGCVFISNPTYLHYLRGSTIKPTVTNFFLISLIAIYFRASLLCVDQGIGFCG